MDIGVEQPAIVIEPVEEPVPSREPAPVEPVEVPDREPVPA